MLSPTYKPPASLLKGTPYILLSFCILSPCTALLRPSLSLFHRFHRAASSSIRMSAQPTFQLLASKYWAGASLQRKTRFPGKEFGGVPGQFLVDISNQIGEGVQHHDAVETAARGAAVAVVLRIASDSSSKLRTDLEEVHAALRKNILATEQRNSNQDTKAQAAEEALRDTGSGPRVEILFISRTIFRAKSNPSSASSVQDAQRWSGQVALPGGKKMKGETDLETAQRECMEETGLDLTSSDFVLVGELPRRMATPSLALSTLVFVQVGGHTAHQLRLDPQEVAAAWWVPLHVLARRSDVTCLSVSLNASSVLPAPFLRALHALGIRRSLFPAIQLPAPPPAQTTMPLQPGQTVLWGLTFGVVCDLLRLGGVQRYGGELPGTAGRWREVRLGYEDGEVSWWASHVSSVLSGAWRALMVFSHRWTRVQLLAAAGLIGALPLARRLLRR